ncbi:MAG TPA: hypothetical protein VHP13_03780 [Gammaproteobacteria bacterium]|jgi:hypothetical protein|nr:hypothetical protein [Gammaproteobacteria bacterium]
MKHKIVLISALPALLLASAGFAAGAPDAGMNPGSSGMDVSKEISTALTHAQMSASSGDIKMVHEHMQHVVNCLVGPQGPEYDANAEDPCKGMGKGAMNDVDSKSAQHKKLDKALTEAKDSLKKDSVKGAQGEAKDVVKYLQDAQEAKPNS